MVNDIFVDNNVSKNFCNPLDVEYKKFIKWLKEKGTLVGCQKLLEEYIASSGGCRNGLSICHIIGDLNKCGRWRKFTKSELAALEIKQHVTRRLRSNKKDHEYIKVVMLSVRKYAIVLDRNLHFDINNFPAYHAKRAKAVLRPQDISYSK